MLFHLSHVYVGCGIYVGGLLGVVKVCLGRNELNVVLLMYVAYVAY